MPNQITVFFYRFYSFICDFLNFPLWNLLKCSQHIASSGIRILNTNKVGVVKAVFRFFFNFLSFTAAKKTSLINLPEKRAPTEVKCVLLIRQILRNFTEGNARKSTVSFAFCAYADVIKYPKSTDVFLWARVDYLRFRPQRASDRKTIGNHLK